MQPTREISAVGFRGVDVHPLRMDGNNNNNSNNNSNNTNNNNNNNNLNNSNNSSENGGEGRNEKSEGDGAESDMLRKGSSDNRIVYILFIYLYYLY